MDAMPPPFDPCTGVCEVGPTAASKLIAFNVASIILCLHTVFNKLVTAFRWDNGLPHAIPFFAKPCANRML